jgi:hypothetical protein
MCSVSPRKPDAVPSMDRPVDPANTWITAISSPTSRTRPRRRLPLRIPDLHHLVIADVGRAFHDDDRSFDAADTDNFLAA